MLEKKHLSTIIKSIIDKQYLLFPLIHKATIFNSIQMKKKKPTTAIHLKFCSIQPFKWKLKHAVEYERIKKRFKYFLNEWESVKKP